MRASHAPPQPCASPDPPGHSSHGHCTAARALSSRSSAAHPLCSFSSSCIWCTRSSSFSAWGITDREARGSQNGTGWRLPCSGHAVFRSQALLVAALAGRNATRLHCSSQKYAVPRSSTAHLLEQLGSGGHVEVRVDTLLLRMETHAACRERPASTHRQPEKRTAHASQRPLPPNKPCTALLLKGTTSLRRHSSALIR